MPSAHRVPVNTINNRLQDYEPGNPVAAIQGLLGDLAHIGYSFNGVSTYGMNAYHMTVSPIATAFTAIAAISWTDQGHVPVTTTEWIPVGGTSPVPVTPAEQAAILAGISARAADLNVTRNVKIGEVNALDELEDVIDYDVTADW